MGKMVIWELMGEFPNQRESWWWNDEVEEKIKTKRAYYKALHKCHSGKKKTLKRYSLAKKKQNKPLVKQSQKLMKIISASWYINVKSRYIYIYIN